MTFAAMTADTGEKVNFESVYSGVPQYERFRSHIWLQAIAQLEAAYERGEADADFGVDFGPALYFSDVVGSRADPAQPSTCAACIRY